MTATCILCKTTLQSKPDPILDEGREGREIATLSEAIVNHMGRDHKPLVDAFTGQMLALFTLGMASHFVSPQPQFAATVEGMHADMKRFIEEKITPGRIPPRTEQPRVEVSKDLPKHDPFRGLAIKRSQ